VPEPLVVKIQPMLKRERAAGDAAGKSAAREPAAFMSRPSPARADFGHLEPIMPRVISVQIPLADSARARRGHTNLAA
jgi:hypothetical protein